MPTRDSFYLHGLYGAATPNVDMTQNFECEKCGHEADMGFRSLLTFYGLDDKYKLGIYRVS